MKKIIFINFSVIPSPKSRVVDSFLKLTRKKTTFRSKNGYFLWHIEAVALYNIDSNDNEKSHQATTGFIL